MIVTIDGPTASGKSTTAQLLARKLNFSYLNSGYLYRALAYLLMHEQGYALEMLTEPRETDVRFFLDGARLQYETDSHGNPVIYFERRDITVLLKTYPKIDQAASMVSSNKLVRDILLELLRVIAAKAHVVVEGRDTGSVVFPHAELKFYLTAPVEFRAKRFMLDKKDRGIVLDSKQAVAEVAIRDERDMARLCAPLIIPDGAIIIDNQDSSLHETVRNMYELVAHHMGAAIEDDHAQNK